MIHTRDDANAIITAETTVCGECASQLSQETRETLLARASRPAPERPAARGSERVAAELAEVDRAEASARSRDELATGSAEGSFVKNGSMSDGDAMPSNWGLWGESAAFRDTTVFKKGPASLCVKTSKAGVGSQARQIIELASSDSFVVSGSMRSEGPAKVQTVVQFWQQSEWVTLRYIEGNTDWSDFSKVIKPPAWASRFSLLLLVDGNGRGWLDEVEGHVVR
jgi:hypothetical protein